jgi:hypothetical protein
MLDRCRVSEINSHVDHMTVNCDALTRGGRESAFPVRPARVGTSTQTADRLQAFDSSRYVQAAIWKVGLGRSKWIEGSCRRSRIDFAVTKDFVTVRTIKNPLSHWYNFP